MKNFTKTFVVLLTVCFGTYLASGQTIKEKIDAAQTVKVYFNNGPIAHSPNTNPAPGSSIPGTGCDKFGETTPLPQEYIDILNGLVDMFNEGFQTTKIVAGDFSSVPKKATGITAGEPDWAELGEEPIFYVNTWGLYSVKMGNEGKVNAMAVQSYLTVYGLKKGKIKILGQKMIASAWTDVVNTQKCDDHAHFVEHFSATMLVDPFKEEIIAGTKEFIDKDMKKYEKSKK